MILKVYVEIYTSIYYVIENKKKQINYLLFNINFTNLTYKVCYCEFWRKCLRIADVINGEQRLVVRIAYNNEDS